MPFHSRPYFYSLPEAEQSSLAESGICLGEHPETEDHLYIPNTDRYAGTYVLGVQGSGKSGLLLNMIHADMLAGHAVIVIDPHGDLITACLNHVPPSRLQNTYLLDMEDESFPFGVNLFSHGKLNTDVEATQAIQRIMHIFEVLWPEVVAQQNLPRYLLAATLTFLANPGATLVDMHTFLQDQAFRNRMLSKVTDPSVLNFWHNQYDNLGPHEQYRRVQPLIGRLEALFMGRSLVRNIVGQRRTTINFRRSIEQKQIVFIKLPIKTVAQDARLIGMILLSQIHGAIFSFANAPADKRPGVSLYVDEFQHFATSDFSELFTEGRKYGLRLTIAHQYRSQVPSFLQAATMTAYSKVCFRLTPEDARELAHEFPTTDSRIMPEDITEHPSKALVNKAADERCIEMFTELYLKPLQGQKRGAGRIEIDLMRYNPGALDLIGAAMNGGERQKSIKVADPTPYLDALLYQVMVTGNAQLDIPLELVRGFSNCGGGFFKAVRRLHHGSKPLTAKVGYPSTLVITRPDGSLELVRPPDGQTERLYFFIANLRQVMQYLAHNPIGKATNTSAADVARMLTNLPKRAAFVRSGDTVGVIYTHDSQPPLKPSELLERAKAILGQTRTTYCYPRSIVEQNLLQPSQPQQMQGLPPIKPVELE